MALEEGERWSDTCPCGHDDNTFEDECDAHDAHGGCAAGVEVLGWIVDDTCSPVAVLGDQDGVAMLAVLVGDGGEAVVLKERLG